MLVTQEGPWRGARLRQGRRPSAGKAEELMDAPTNDQELDPVDFEPTSAEIEAWADKERQRRQAWLSGPSEDERAAFVRRERARRAMRSETLEMRAAGMARRSRRYGRDSQLAAEGAASLL